MKTLNEKLGMGDIKMKSPTISLGSNLLVKILGSMFVTCEDLLAECIFEAAELCEVNQALRHENF